MSEKIPMSAPDLDELDIEGVVSVLRSGRLALGPRTIEFEQSMADYIGVKYAIAVSSGTAALHLIVKALDIGVGDEVLVPSFTFAASVNAFLLEGATPVFVDIESETYNLDTNDLEHKISPLTKAIMAVDVFGHPAEWDEILRIADKHKLKVIDDSCEALGAQYKSQPVGRFGNAAAFGFYPNKQMTTGEGGMILTDDATIASFCCSLRNQGRNEMGSWLEHDRLGYNYRLDEMSAALGVSQLKRIDQHLAKREEVARSYSARLRKLDWVRMQVVKSHVRMSWFVFVVTLAEGIDRDLVMEGMEARGIPVRAYFSPIHLQPYIKKRFDTSKWQLPITEEVARRTLALPFHNNITDAQIDEVVTALEQAADEAQVCTIQERQKPYKSQRA